MQNGRSMSCMKMLLGIDCPYHVRQIEPIYIREHLVCIFYCLFFAHPINTGLHATPCCAKVYSTMLMEDKAWFQLSTRDHSSQGSRWTVAVSHPHPFPSRPGSLPIDFIDDSWVLHSWVQLFSSPAVLIHDSRCCRRHTLLALNVHSCCFVSL